jgi:hypothetical protein
MPHGDRRRVCPRGLQPDSVAKLLGGPPRRIEICLRVEAWTYAIFGLTRRAHQRGHWNSRLVGPRLSRLSRPLADGGPKPIQHVLVHSQNVPSDLF